MTVSDYPFCSLGSDQNCFGAGACRLEDEVLDFKCLVLCSHIKCSSEAVTASVWFFVLSGIWRKNLGLYLLCLVRIWNVWASAGCKCTPNPAVNSRTTSSQAVIYRCCTSHSTLSLAYPNLTLCLALLSGQGCRWLSHAVHMPALLAGGPLS